MAWIGILGDPGCLRNDRRMRAGTYPPPPIAIMRLGLKSLRIRGAASWQSLWTCRGAVSFASQSKEVIYLVIGHILLDNHFRDRRESEWQYLQCDRTKTWKTLQGTRQCGMSPKKKKI